MWRSVLAGMLILGASASAHARDASTPASPVSFSFGTVLTSHYVSEGIRLTKGAAVQPYFEFGLAGFYAGAYLTNADKNKTLYNYESGLSFGYRGIVDRLTYDIGVIQYFFDEAFRAFPVVNYQEVKVSGTFTVTDTFYLTATAKYAPEFEQTIVSMRADYYTPFDGFSVGALIGRIDANFGSWTYWSVDATYKVNKHVSLSIGYHNSNVSPLLGLTNTDGLIVGTLTLSY